MTAATAGRLFHARHPLPIPGGRTRRSTTRLRLVADRHLAASDERIHQAQRAAAAANLAAARTMRDELRQSAKDQYVHGVQTPALVGSVRQIRRWPWPKWTWTIKDFAAPDVIVDSGTARDEVTARRDLLAAIDRERRWPLTMNAIRARFGLGDLS